MSAILNALKKLEDEKNSIDDSISLNELKINSGCEEPPNPFGEKMLRWRSKILLILAGIVFGGLIGKFY
jgi:hypothetical protein